MKKIIPVVIILLLVGAFYGGMKYAQSKSPQGFTQGDFQNFRNLSDEERQGIFQGMDANVGSGLRAGRMMRQEGEGFANGEIIAKDKQSITVKLPDGGSKIIFFSEITEIRKMTDGLATDLVEGEQVMITGKQNADGSITAESIQLSPVQMFNRSDKE